MWTEEDIKRVRNTSILKEMGINNVSNRRRTLINCPMPNHNDKTASFLVDAENGFHCFGCGVHGHGFIDFCTEILKQKGVSKKEIFKTIMDEYGGN